MKCADCKWWLEDLSNYYGMSEIFRDDLEYRRGACRKALPVAGVGWPRTSGDDFCGEFSLKKEKSEK